MNNQLSSIKISIVIPVLNEIENVETLSFEISEALKSCQNYEIIFVDDGSNDGTKNKIIDLSMKFPQIRLIVHDKCYGQSVAMRSGIIKSKYDLIGTLDGDGQNDPNDLIFLIIDYLSSKNNLCLVAGIRKNRKDNFNKRIASKIAMYFRYYILGDKHPDSGCGIRVFDKELYLMMPFFNHMHRFFTVLASWQNAEIIGSSVNHRERIRGQSKYNNYKRAIQGLVDLLGVLWLKRRTPKNFSFKEQELNKKGKK